MPDRGLHLDSERLGLCRSFSRGKITARFSPGREPVKCREGFGGTHPRPPARYGAQTRRGPNENVICLRFPETAFHLRTLGSAPRHSRAANLAAPDRDRSARDSSDCVSLIRPGAQAERTLVPPLTRFCRCPACGEPVDNQAPEQVRGHHHHVLHRDGVAQRSTLSSAAHHHAAQTWIHGVKR
jgi:hypothetical protein